jgi:hypothetical protein
VHVEEFGVDWAIPDSPAVDRASMPVPKVGFTQTPPGENPVLGTRWLFGPVSLSSADELNLKCVS